MLANAKFDWHRTLHEDSVSSIWSQHHVPAANTQATATQALAGKNARNVCTWLTVTLAGGAVAPAAVNVSVSLIDGASGGTTFLWRKTMSLAAVAGQENTFGLSGLWLVGSQNTAMTLEFSAAGGANTFESVSFGGTQIFE